jgi:hypothetical protein
LIDADLPVKAGNASRLRVRALPVHKFNTGLWADKKPDFPREMPDFLQTFFGGFKV